MNINERTSQLAALHARMFPPKPVRKALSPPSEPPGLSDEDLLAKARAARKGAKFTQLYDTGGWEGAGYRSQSEADLALVSQLVFWTGGDIAAVDRLFRSSGLMRPKWDEPHGERTYGEMTTSKALTESTDFYKPARAERRRADRRNGRYPASTAGEPELTGFALTDYGNAERLVALHGHDVHYVHAWGRWLTWDAHRWAHDETGEVVRRAKDTVRLLFKQAMLLHKSAAQRLQEAATKEDEKAAQELLSMANTMLVFARRSEQAPRLTAMLELARSEPGIPVTTGELDTDRWALNVPNGTLDLHTGELGEHSREDLITKLAPVEYDPGAPCPLWERFLARIFADDTELVRFVQRSVGYGLTGDVGEHVMFFLYGLGANGKSTLLNIILYILGDYAKRAAPELLVVSSNTDRHPTERADLFGARFVASIEIEAGRKLAEVLVKDMTGGDRMKARWLYRDFFEWAPTHKLFLAANHKPTIRGTDHAIWRRILLIPFAVTIPEQERDRQLGEKLKAEGPGILRWAVEGCLEWQKRGLDAPDTVRTATASYRDESDVLGEFLDGECVLDPETATPASELYQRYVGWCERVKDKPIAKAAFGQHLSERGLESTRTKNLRLWRGIRLRGPGDTGDEGDVPSGETAPAHARVMTGFLEPTSPASPTSPPEAFA